MMNLEPNTNHEIPDQQPRQFNEKGKSHRSPRIIILVSVAFLSLAVLLTTGAAFAAYQFYNQRNVTVAASTALTQPTLIKPIIGSSGSQVIDGGSSSTPATNKSFSIASAATKQGLDKKALSIMQISKANKPAVVAISTKGHAQNAFGQIGLFESAGSGFIISKEGYIVTNYHVIEGAQTISIALDNSSILPAVLVGHDKNNDLAVLKIEGKDFPAVILGNSAELEVGELAVAIGNPLGELSGTVTAGIISALDRKVDLDYQTLDLIQTDAAINAGNSGGALINSFGEVIGINTAKNSGNGVEGLGFAIPIDTAKPIIESLIQKGYVAGRPKIGIITQTITDQLAQSNNLRIGVLIRTVEKGSAADIAGLRDNDIIIQADGKDIKTAEALVKAKDLHKNGETMVLTIVRDGKEMAINLLLKEDVRAAA